MHLHRSNARRLPAAAVSMVLAILLTPPQLRAAAPELSCSPTHVHFADVLVGQTETLVVIATNSGKSSVTILGVGADDSNFKIANLALPQVLAAGASLALGVTFAPTAKGGAGGVLRVVSNANNRIVTVALSGTGVTREAVSV